MTALTQANDRNLPTSLPLSLDWRLSKLSNKLTPVGLGHEILAEDAPTEQERDDLRRRSAALAVWLQPSDPEHIVKHVTALMAVRPGQFGEIEDRKKAIRIFAQTLADLPRFALDKAFEDAHAGRLGAPPWVPTPADLHVAAVKHVAALAREKAKIDAVLNAKVIAARSDPERRAAVAAAARNALKGMREEGRKAECERTGLPFEPEEVVKAMTAQDWIEHAREVGSRPLDPLSEEVRRKFGSPGAGDHAA